MEHQGGAKLCLIRLQVYLGEYGGRKVAVKMITRNVIDVKSCLSRLRRNVTGFDQSELPKETQRSGSFSSTGTHKNGQFQGVRCGNSSDNGCTKSEGKILIVPSQLSSFSSLEELNI